MVPSLSQIIHGLRMIKRKIKRIPLINRGLNERLRGHARIAWVGGRKARLCEPLAPATAGVSQLFPIPPAVTIGVERAEPRPINGLSSKG